MKRWETLPMFLRFLPQILLIVIPCWCLKDATAFSPASHLYRKALNANVVLNAASHRHNDRDQHNLTRRSILSTASTTFSLFIPSISTAGSPGITAAIPSKELDSASSDPPITHYVSMNVRIARSDGSYYIRDDLPDTPENTVYNYSLMLGLFGTIAPVHVSEFLKYVVPTGQEEDLLDERPAPRYSRSIFSRLNPADGLLEGGDIPGLEVTRFGGGTGIQYMEKVYPAPLWVEQNAGVPKLSHGTGRGLLTHRNLDASPRFGITTRSNADLDGSHTVFGRLLLEEGDGDMFLRTAVDLPTYSMDRPELPQDMTDTPTERAAGELASAVFSAQRQIFRKAAENLGDTRVGKVFEGKLLRKVSVTRVQLFATDEKKRTRM